MELLDLPDVQPRKMSFDVIMDQINRVEKSKLNLFLKVIYAVVVGLAVSNLSKGRVRWHKSLGVLASLLTFYMARIIGASQKPTDESRK